MPYFYGFDITYFIFIIPALIFGLWAQISVKSAFSKYSRISTARGITGAEAAKLLGEVEAKFPPATNVELAEAKPPAGAPH